MDGRPGGIGHEAPVWGDPVDNGVRVASGFAAQGHALTLQSSQLLGEDGEGFSICFIMRDADLKEHFGQTIMLRTVIFAWRETLWITEIT